MVNFKLGAASIAAAVGVEENSSTADPDTIDHTGHVDHYSVTLLDNFLYFVLSPLVVFFCVVKLLRFVQKQTTKKQKETVVRQRFSLFAVIVAKMLIIAMEIVDLGVLSDSDNRYDSPATEDYCFQSGQFQIFLLAFENILVIWYSRMLLLQVSAPTTSQKMLQIKAVISSLLLAALISMTLGQVLTIGLCKPISCWIKNDDSSVLDEILSCWMMALVPFGVINLIKLMKYQTGLISKVLQPYVERMTVYLALSILTVMFEVYCQVMEAFIPDFRDTRRARYLNLLLNLGSLFFISLALIIPLEEDLIEGIKSHTVGELAACFGGGNRHRKGEEDDEFYSAGGDTEASSIGGERTTIAEFTRHYAPDTLSSENVLQLAANVNLINIILLGMTEVMMHRSSTCKRIGADSYYSSQQLNNLVNEEDYEGLEEWCDESAQFEVCGPQFIQDNPDFQIGGFDVNTKEHVEVTEYAPQVFRILRREFISEADLFQSFKPSNNSEGIFNFKTGEGKSPSFFFFTDDKRLMIKTLKQSEKEILFGSKKFLLEYVKFLVNNPDSMLMKILGIFEVRICDQKELTFLLTENMVGRDANRVFRCFDLKGSLYGRYVKLKRAEILKGSGLKPLKDKNLIQFNKVQPLVLPEDEKASLIRQLELDSAFLRDQNLIDYSLFLLQVDRSRILRKEEKSLMNLIPKLIFDQGEGSFRLTFVKKDSEDQGMQEPATGDALNNESCDDNYQSTSKSKLGKVRSVVYSMLEKKEETNPTKGFAEINSRDGTYRYKMGVIDFLTVYDNTKYLENQLKSTIRNVDSAQISAINAPAYQSRFIQFMEEQL